MATESRGALLATASAAGKALSEMTNQIGLSIGFGVLMLFLYGQSDGKTVILIGILLGAPLAYLIYRAIRALGKEVRLYEGGLGYVSSGNEHFFAWPQIRSITGAVPVVGEGQQGYLGGNLVVLLHSGDSFYADEHFEALDRFVKLLYAQAGTHLLPDIIDRLYQGEGVDLGSMRATPAGLEVGGTILPWENVTKVAYDVHPTHCVCVHTESGLHSLPIQSTYNAALIPHLVDTMQAAPPAPEALDRYQAEPLAGSPALTGPQEFHMSPALTYINYGGAGFFLVAALGFVILARTGPTPPPAVFEVGVLGLLVVMAMGFFVVQWRMGDLRFITSDDGLKRLCRDTEDFVPWNQIVNVDVSGGENKSYRITTANQGVWKFYGGLAGLEGHDRLYATIKSHVKG